MDVEYSVGKCLIYLLVENSDSEFSEMVYLFSASDFEHLYSYLSDAFEGRSEQ